uniref:Ribonuclease H-like domain-containing protein n=1 Tax=Tanacetum cinerariifolium TaxID=118510 RepID=A0A6L2MYS7_TANCI|nr:ribonuclease H-like domain-containing protein [Tanacetum cinerariifolium]
MFESTERLNSSGTEPMKGVDEPKWTPNVDLLKDDMNLVPIWVKFYDILIVAFTADGLSVMDTKLGHDYCFPKGEDDEDVLHTIRGSSNSCKKAVQDVAGSAVDNMVKKDNDSEVEEVYDETATYMTSMGFNVNKASNSGTGEGNKSLYKQWKENHAEDPYDDDNFDDPGLTDAQMKFANAFDTNLHVKDFLTRHILLRCDSSGDLYPVTSPSPTPHALLSVSPSMWHQRLRHPKEEILVPKPPNVNVVRSMWLFRHKYHVDGSLSRYKARLVAIGCNQQYGVDCNDTFSPVVKPATKRTVLSLALAQNWPVHKLDVKNAFLNSDLTETIYMYQPSGFVDSCFPHHHGTEVGYLLIYVGDIVLTASSTTLLQRIIASLHKEFDITDLGALNYFLRISVTRDATESKLGSDGDPVSDSTLYCSLAGGLQYLTFTRPDIPMTCNKYVFICMTLGSLIWLLSNGFFVIFVVTLSRSSAEAEYRGVANVVAETAWIRNLLRELHNPLFTATLVYCDNVSAVYMSTNPFQHQRTKHIEIDIHFVRDMVARGHVRVLHVPSRYQYADIFTKGLPTALFEEFRTSLSVRSSPAQTASEC